MCQNSLPSGVGRSLGAKISGGRCRPWGIFFGFYKTRDILLSNGANCTVLRAVVLTQYRRVTDGQTDGRTDGIAVDNTALAMRALRLAAKMELSGKTAYGPVLKTTELSARAHNHASPFTIIFLGDHDFPLTGSNFGNLTAFRAIFTIFSLRMRRNGHL